MSDQWERRKRELELKNLEASILQTVQLQTFRDLGRLLGHILTTEKAIDVLLQELKLNGTPVSSGIAQRTMKAISRMSGKELAEIGREKLVKESGGVIRKMFIDAYAEGLERGREDSKWVLLESEESR